MWVDIKCLYVPRVTLTQYHWWCLRCMSLDCNTEDLDNNNSVAGRWTDGWTAILDSSHVPLLFSGWLTAPPTGLPYILLFFFTASLQPFFSAANSSRHFLFLSLTLSRRLHLCPHRIGLLSFPKTQPLQLFSLSSFFPLFWFIICLQHQ